MGYIKKNGRLLYVKDSTEVGNDNECIVKIKYCGVCGTDFQKYISLDEITEWGHEIVGLVEGEEEKGAVTIRTSFPCGNCEECMNHNPQLCTDWTRCCINGYSDKVAIDRRNVLFLNETDIDPVFTLVEPLYVARSLIERVDLQVDDRLAIIGNGTIALLAGFLARKSCTTIAIMARNHTRRRTTLEENLGLNQYGFSEMQKQLWFYNKIIVTTPYTTISDVIRYSKSISMVSFKGISSESIVSINANTWHFKNLEIWPSFPHPQSDFSGEIEIIKKNKPFLRRFITAIYPGEQIRIAFQNLAKNKKDHIKMVIGF